MFKKVLALLIGFLSLSSANDLWFLQNPSIRPSLSETQINNPSLVPKSSFSYKREMPLNQTIESMLLMMAVVNYLLAGEHPPSSPAPINQDLLEPSKVLKKKDTYKKDFHFQPRKQFSPKYLKQYSSTPHFQRKPGRYKGSIKQ